MRDDIYADPAFYDAIAPDDPAMAAFYTEGLGAGQPVLELACGTGRFTLPLAASGADVVGGDADPGMLEAARQRLSGAGQAAQLRRASVMARQGRMAEARQLLRSASSEGATCRHFHCICLLGQGTLHAGENPTLRHPADRREPFLQVCRSVEPGCFSHDALRKTVRSRKDSRQGRQPPLGATTLRFQPQYRSGLRSGTQNAAALPALCRSSINPHIGAGHQQTLPGSHGGGLHGRLCSVRQSHIGRSGSGGRQIQRSAIASAHRPIAQSCQQRQKAASARFVRVRGLRCGAVPSGMGGLGALGRRNFGGFHGQYSRPSEP